MRVRLFYVAAGWWSADGGGLAFGGRHGDHTQTVVLVPIVIQGQGGWREREVGMLGLAICGHAARGRRYEMLGGSSGD